MLNLNRNIFEMKFIKLYIIGQMMAGIRKYLRLVIHDDDPNYLKICMFNYMINLDISKVSNFFSSIQTLS